MKKFLEFNGKSIYFLAVDGSYYVALKPICEALGLDWIAQYKAVRRNHFLDLVLSNQTIPDARNHAQQMACLPEKYVYGWMFKLQSSAPGFEEFQMKCYELLYDYFHGILARRISTLAARHVDEKELTKIQQELTSTPEWKKMEMLKKSLKGYSRTLIELDQDLSHNQINLFS